MKTFDIDTSAPATGRASIRIAAPTSRVWTVLSDFESWPSWNPSISSMRMEGRLRPGTTFVWKTGGMTIRSHLQVVEAPRTLGWTGEALFISARHVYRLSENRGVTLVETEESFTGLFARMLPGMASKAINSALESGLAALKLACEDKGRTPAPKRVA